MRERLQKCLTALGMECDEELMETFLTFCQIEVDNALEQDAMERDTHD